MLRSMRELSKRYLGRGLKLLALTLGLVLIVVACGGPETVAPALPDTEGLAPVAPETESVAPAPIQSAMPDAESVAPAPTAPAPPDAESVAPEPTQEHTTLFV